MVCSSLSTLPTLPRAAVATQYFAQGASPAISTFGLYLWEDWKPGGNGGSAVSLNVFKCSTATLLFLVLHIIQPCVKLPTPSAASGLFLSSFLGIIVGDSLWLWALGTLGAEQTVLLTALSPFLATVVGFLMLHQPFKPTALIGMAIACAGIYLAQVNRTCLGRPSQQLASADATPQPAVQEGGVPTEPAVQEGGVPDGLPVERKPWASEHKMKIGVAVQLVNVLLDQIGAALTRQHGVGLSTWTINLWRFGFAGGVGLLFYAAMLARTRRVANWQAELPTWAKWPSASKMDRRKWGTVLLGVLLVTFSCPALNAYALFGMDLGVWALLGALGPAYSPLVKLAMSRRNRTTAFGWAGAVLAGGGAALTAWCSATAAV